MIKQFQFQKLPRANEIASHFNVGFGGGAFGRFPALWATDW